MEWYVVHAYSGYENKVRETLIERIERFGMEENFGEIMVPSEEVIELRGGQERKIQRKKLNFESRKIRRKNLRICSF